MTTDAKKWEKYAISAFCCVVVVSCFILSNQETRVKRFYPFENGVGRAVENVILENGYYKHFIGICKVRLKNEKISSNGILINYDIPEKALDSNMLVKVNNKITNKVNLKQGTNQTVIIDNNLFISDLNDEYDLVLESTNNNLPIKLNYIGPIIPLSEFKPNSFLLNSASGFYAYHKDKSNGYDGRMIGREAVVYINSEEVSQKGLEISYTILPDTILDSNRPLKLQVYVNDLLIKNCNITEPSVGSIKLNVENCLNDQNQYKIIIKTSQLSDSYNEKKGQGCLLINYIGTSR